MGISIRRNPISLLACWRKTRHIPNGNTPSSCRHPSARFTPSGRAALAAQARRHRPLLAGVPAGRLRGGAAAGAGAAGQRRAPVVPAPPRAPPAGGSRGARLGRTAFSGHGRPHLVPCLERGPKLLLFIMQKKHQLCGILINQLLTIIKLIMRNGASPAGVGVAFRGCR